MTLGGRQHGGCYRTIPAPMSWLARYRIPLVLFVVGLLGFGAVAGARLSRQSTDPHFVLLADAWLHGSLHIDPAKKRGDDWAVLETVRLDDGREVSGRRLSTRKSFRVAGGDEIPLTRVQRTVDRRFYVSFPPVPALLMLPAAAIWGDRANDVIPTAVVAALVLPLAFLVLRRLAEAGASPAPPGSSPGFMAGRTPAQDIWLVLALGFGTVFYFAAVQGRVWYTAHVVGVALALAYASCAIEARRPILAGLFLGLAAMTRTPMAFMFPLFALEAWRVHGGRQHLGRVLRAWAAFAAPIVVIAIAGMIHNYLRFAEPTEFGHSYLAVRQQAQMEAHGMFAFHYLSRNLAVAFALLPRLSAAPPYIAISGHGLALWFTTPILLLLLWPRERPPLHRTLWLTVALVAVPTLFYQNSGWFQFGYRFALDYMVFLFMLLAIGGRPLTRTVKALIIAGVLINLFGAITFHRDHRFYRADRATYQTVIEH